MPLELPVQRIKTLLRAGNQKVKLTGEGTQIKQKRRLFWGHRQDDSLPFPKIRDSFPSTPLFLHFNQSW